MFILKFEAEYHLCSVHCCPLFLLLFPNSFIHSLNKYFLRNSYVLGILIGARDTEANRMDLFPVFTI